MAKIRDYLGQKRYHIVYETNAIHDKESALKWVADLTDIKTFCVKKIILNAGCKYEIEIPSRLFSKDKFVKEYLTHDFEAISVNFNFHQYEAVFLIDLSKGIVELMFPKTTMIDYKMIEDCLNLNN